MTTTKRTFDNLLKLFVQQQNALVGTARDCSHLALDHFAEHGDVVYLQRFHDAMKQNFMRRQAFITWVCDFAPIIFDKGVFSKNKADNAVPLRVNEAKRVDWWDHKPEVQVLFYAPTQILEALERTIKQFSDTSRRAPAPGSNAEIALQMAAKMVENFGKNVQQLNVGDSFNDETPTTPAN